MPDTEDTQRLRPLHTEAQFVQIAVATAGNAGVYPVILALDENGNVWRYGNEVWETLGRGRVGASR